MSTTGRHTTIEAGRAEAQRRHPGRVSPAAEARQAVEAADRERPLVPDAPGPTRSSDNEKRRALRRREAAARYDLGSD